MTCWIGCFYSGICCVIMFMILSSILLTMLTLVVGDKMTILLVSFIVFGLTLILTKSKILGSKREFVQKRYASSKINGNPSLIHRWWHAMWTCPMCSGFWVAIPVCFYYPVHDMFSDVIIVFALNWLIHVVENCIFFIGKIAEKVDSEDFSFEGLE